MKPRQGRSSVGLACLLAALLPARPFALTLSLSSKAEPLPANPKVSPEPSPTGLLKESKNTELSLSVVKNEVGQLPADESNAEQLVRLPAASSTITGQLPGTERSTELPAWAYDFDTAKIESAPMGCFKFDNTQQSLMVTGDLRKLEYPETVGGVLPDECAYRCRYRVR